MLDIELIVFDSAATCLRPSNVPTPYLSVFSPNAGKCGKNAGENNSEHGHFLRSAHPTQTPSILDLLSFT